MKILIVEDIPDIAEALTKLLTVRMDHVECRTASTLEEGLRVANEFHADLTLLDLILTDSPLEKVINSIGLFTPPVIVVTELADDKDILLACMANRAQKVISKRGLLGVLDSIGSNIKADELVIAIIDAHLRNVAPGRKSELTLCNVR
ncbi:MAG: response regulator [Luteolibacter sp.]